MDYEKYRIRSATHHDIPALGAIEAAGDAQFPADRFPGEPGSDNVPIPELEAGRCEGLLFVAESAGIVVGFLLAVIRGEQLHIRQVVVLPDRQGQGIGRAFLEKTFSEAECRGLTEITLTTFDNISWNAPFYRHFGFEIMNPEDLSPFLQEDLKAERDAGMTHRVAMTRRVC